MKSKFFLAVFTTAVAFTVMQSGKLNAQGSILPDDETMTECDPTVQVVCAVINSITYYGKYKTP